MPPNLIDLGYAAKLPPEKAIAFFAAKGYAVSWNWWEVWESAHARAFTVAKAVQADVLESIRGALDKALADGRTRREFARDLEPRLRALGWWGRQIVVSPDGGAEKVQLGSPHRLRTIFDSNMRSTFGAARQRQQVENADSRPFWMYDARNDNRVRPSHAAMDGRVFRADDPIWKTHYPPNGWNCRCRVRALTAAQVRARGLRVSDSAGSLETVQQEVGVDKRTGEVVTKPGTAYRFRAGGEVRVMTPDPGWGAAPRGLPPAAGAPSTFNPGAASPAAARAHLDSASAGARQRLADREAEIDRLNASINDPATPITSRDLAARAAAYEARDAARRDLASAGRRAILRERATPFQGSGEPSWANAALLQRHAPLVEEWRRLIAPRLLSRLRAPRIRESALHDASAAYWRSIVGIHRDSRAAVVMHELSHLLEADRQVFNRAVDFLQRRTRGDPLAVVDSRGSLGRRDKFRDLDGQEYFYPGRVFAAGGGDIGSLHQATLQGAPGHPPARRAGDRGDVEMHATEVVSMGVQWMWENPVAFAASDPEYFDFIWDTVIR